MASWFTNRMTRITRPDFYELVLSRGTRCDDAWFHLNECPVCRKFHVNPPSPITSRWGLCVVCYECNYNTWAPFLCFLRDHKSIPIRRRAHVTFL